MSNRYYTSFSLRDMFRMGSSTKRNRLGRAPKNAKKEYYQPRTSTRTSYAGRNAPQYTDYGSPTYAKPTSYHTSRKSHLSNLPPEIKLEIFDTLDPISSTCLGLTSKKFYPLHRSTHKHVPLYNQSSYDNGLSLCCLLKDWAPDNMVLDSRSGKLVSRERYGELGRERARKERERDRRVGWEREYREYREAEGRRGGDRYCLHPGYESYYEVATPRLRRKRKLERHDLWYDGGR